MIGRLTDRNDFHRLQQQGRRSRDGSLWMAWVTDGALVHPRVGYAVGRTVGRAVVRNHVKRRLRSIMIELSREGWLPGGLYLVGARAGADQIPFVDLTSSARTLVRSAGGSVPA